MNDVQHVVETAEAGGTAAPVAGQADRAAVHPWRRYFARMVDNTLNSFLLMALVMLALALAWPKGFEACLALLESLNRVADLVLSIALAVIANALVMGATGSTLGKWVFGVRVREADGRKLGLARALKREFMVWVRGLGFGVPLVSLFTMVRGYNQLENHGRTTWDRDMQLEISYRPQGAVQWVTWTLVVLAWIAVTMLSVITV